MSIKKNIKRLEDNIGEINVQLATIGGHVKNVNNRLESGSRKFLAQESELKVFDSRIDKIRKSTDQIASNQRLFLLVFSGIGFLVSILFTAWVNYLFNTFTSL